MMSKGSPVKSYWSHEGRHERTDTDTWSVF